jgi:hypothetical protein
MPRISRRDAAEPPDPAEQDARPAGDEGRRADQAREREHERLPARKMGPYRHGLTGGRLTGRLSSRWRPKRLADRSARLITASGSEARKPEAILSRFISGVLHSQGGHDDAVSSTTAGARRRGARVYLPRGDAWRHREHSLRRPRGLRAHERRTDLVL